MTTGNHLNALDRRRGCSEANIALNVLIALLIGGCVLVLLILLHHSAWPAFLSGLLSAIIYDLFVLPRWLFHRKPETVSPPKRMRTRPWTGHLDMRGQSIAITLLSALTVALGGMLYILPDQPPIFLLLSAVLGLLFCIGLFYLGLLILTTFLARGDKHNVVVEISDDDGTP